MNVLLIDADSTIPNLALMKYSTYYKEQGHNVGRNIEDPDIVIGSIMFDKNRYMADSWGFFYPDAKMMVGGPGYDPSVRLPLEVERSRPDYGIYPGYKDSIGRVTIGCPNSCYFCKVPKMGNIRYVQPVKDFYQGGTLRLLDDNLFALPWAWDETASYLIENSIPVILESVDIRRVTPKIADDLSMIKTPGQFHFAFDMISYKDELIEGVKTLENAGVKPYRLMFYVYLHNEKAIDDAVRRWEILRNLGVEPFLMVNMENITPRLKRIRRRGDRPAIWRGLSAKEVFA